MIMVVYHEQKVSRKSGWKENGTRIFGFQRKISGSRGKSEKVVLFPRSEQSKRKFAFLFFTVIFDSSFRPLRPLFGKWKRFEQMVNAITERNLPVLNYLEKERT